MKNLKTFTEFLNESNTDVEFKRAMKEYGFKPGSEKDMFVTKDGHGNEVRILEYKNKTLKGLVYESRFGPSGTYEWSYGAWDQNGRNTAGYSMMADISKPIAQDAIKHFS
jgi:hypothetical protein